MRACAHWPDVVVVVRGPGGDAEEGEREEEEDGVEGGEHLQEVSERRQHVELLPRQHLHGRMDGWMGQILKTVIGKSESVFPNPDICLRSGNTDFMGETAVRGITQPNVCTAPP